LLFPHFFHGICVGSSSVFFIKLVIVGFSDCPVPSFPSFLGGTFNAAFSPVRLANDHLSFPFPDFFFPVSFLRRSSTPVAWPGPLVQQPSPWSFTDSPLTRDSQNHSTLYVALPGPSSLGLEQTNCLPSSIVESPMTQNQPLFHLC